MCPSETSGTEEKVYDSLFTLDITKANGHDDISARMLKHTAIQLQE